MTMPLTDEVLTEDSLDDLFSGCEASEPTEDPAPTSKNQSSPIQVAETDDISKDFKEVLSDFDTLAAGEKISKDTVVLEMHINRAGNAKKLDPKRLLSRQPKTAPCDLCGGQGMLAGADCENCSGTGTITTQVDPDYFNANKILIDPKELKPIRKILGQLVKFRNHHTVKATMLADGFYVLPKKFIKDLDDQVALAQDNLETELDKLEPRWQEIIQSSKPNLGEHWDEKDYLPFNVWRNEWSINFKYRSLNVPAMLQEFDEAIAKREYEKLRGEWANTAQEVRDAHRAGFTFLVKDFADKLGKDDQGEYKTFTVKLIEKLKEFCLTFEARDLTDDTKLAGLANQVRQLVEGVDPKALRKDEGMRSMFEANFKKIAEEAGKLVVVRDRTIDFDDEDV